MSGEVITVIVGVGSAVMSFFFFAIRQSKEKAKELADAVLIQNTNYNALVTRVAVLESKVKP